MNKSFTSVALRVALISVFCSSVFVACRKDSKPGQDGTGPGTVTTAVTDEDSLKYLMYHTMEVSYVDGGRSTTTSLPTYYWYSQVPGLDPVSSKYASAEALLEVMKTYSKGTGSTVLDRYSFLDRTGSLSSALQDGVSEVNRKISATGTYGMEVGYAADRNNKTYLYILYADKNSPAGLQGLTRGDLITAINGDTSLSYDGPNGPRVTKVINAIYKSTSVALNVTKGTTQTSNTYNITAASYNINPVLFDTTFTVDGQNTGYFVFYTFTSTVNTKGGYTNTKTVLDAVFNKFKSANISNLIVDLRYNGGGSVTTAEYLDSAIAGVAAAGKPMYYYTYNDKLTANASDAGLETRIDFPANTGGLALNNVFFITSRNTASASELTLNNLKPYMKVKLVGDSTYGKPVGFITFTLNKYDSTHKEKYLADLYAINFATENAEHSGAYFSGIAVDQQATDYIDVPWGNPNDEHLDYIFNYIRNGKFERSAAGARLATKQSFNLRASLPASIVSPRFNGMVDYRFSRRLK